MQFSTTGNKAPSYCKESITLGKVSKALNKAISLVEDGDSLTEVENLEDFHTIGSQQANESIEESTIIQPEISRATIENWDERLANSADKYSGITESIAKLRSKILYPETGERISSIMVSSSSPEEGKSFVCANLGISIAQSMERHALMLDCDLRRPTLQNLFGLKFKKGLTDYLQDKEDLHSLIKPSGLPKLSIIPSGSPPRNPAELVTSHKMLGLLDEVRSRYNDRLIVLDSPPFLAASETLVLSQQVDKVIIVVRWGKSSRESIKKMVDSIGKEKILGIVFNAFEMNLIDRKIQGLSYYNYYSESYY